MAALLRAAGAAAAGVLLVVVVALQLSVRDAAALRFASSLDYVNCATLSVPQKVNLAWTVNGSVVHMALWAPVPNGYVAAGFSTSGDMSGGTKGFAEIWMVR